MRLLQKLMTYRKLMQVVERRGHTREVVEHLLAREVRDKSFFADRAGLEAFADAVSREDRSVTLVADEEHNLFQLLIEDRSSGYPRRHSLTADFLTTGEYRQLSGGYRDVQAFLHGPFVVATSGAAPADEDVAETAEPPAEARPRPRGRDEQVSLPTVEDAGRVLHRRRKEGNRDQPLQGPRRDEPRPALGHHDEAGCPHAAAGACRRPRGSRLDVHNVDGRSGGAATEVHRRQRPRREEPGRVDVNHRDTKARRRTEDSLGMPCSFFVRLRVLVPL